MKAILTQAGPGLSLFQGGLGPIVTLGFGASGAAASLATAPIVEDFLPDDLLAVQRGGQLMLVPKSVFMAAQNGSLQQLAQGLQPGGAVTGAEGFLVMQNGTLVVVSAAPVISNYVSSLPRDSVGLAGGSPYLDAGFLAVSN